jgi:hypothetical protein
MAISQIGTNGIANGAVVSADIASGAVALATQVSGTLPVANGGTGMTSGGPAFSVYKTTDQSVSSATWTKLTFTGEIFDTNNNFASSTFTPTVAGYYQFNWNIEIYATSCTRMAVALYKNGTSSHYSGFWTMPSGTWDNEICAGAVIYMNGSTDYVEIYALITGTSPTIYSSATFPVGTGFNGSLVRSA